MQILALIAYWLLFWRKFLWNPYLLCTSEVASTFFPHWIWMGRQLRRGIFPAQDEIYYKLPGSIPFLATFYPPNLISAWLGSFLKQDDAFKLYCYFILSHFLLCSILTYWLTHSLFAAITLAYAGYCIKPNTPTFVYTACWVPLALKGGSLGIIGWFMALTGGYFPILVYTAPVVAIVAPLSFIGGCLLASPQLIPFLGYFKRSVRNGESVDKNFGRVPAYRLLDLISPIRHIETTNGVLYTEMMMYMGIAPFLMWPDSYWCIPLIIGILICIGFIPCIQRISGRALYVVTLSIVLLMCKTSSIFLVLQSFLLLKNSSIYPSFPFTQWWDRPSRLYQKSPMSYNWPYATGYLKGVRTSDYLGAFRLRN